MMNGIELLKKQHNELKSVMTSLESNSKTKNSDNDKIDKLFQKFKDDFQLHDKIETKVLYKKMKEYPKLKTLALKSEQAHHIVEVGLLELRLLPYFSDSWLPKFLVVKDSILMHMHEEEKEILPEVEKTLNETELKKLGSEMQAIVNKYKD